MCNYNVWGVVSGYKHIFFTYFLAISNISTCASQPECVPVWCITCTHSPLSARHPSNLMLDRLSGRILHIDFGDCFEVAMTREKFPEKIPFRLTRMLTNAMEV